MACLGKQVNARVVAGSNKGGIEQGTVFNSPFALGAMTPEREAYTSAAVVDVLPGVTDGGEYTLAWTPLAPKFTPTIVGGESGAYIEVIDGATGRIKVHGATGDIRVKYLYEHCRSADGRPSVEKLRELMESPSRATMTQAF